MDAEDSNQVVVPLHDLSHEVAIGVDNKIDDVDDKILETPARMPWSYPVCLCADDGPCENTCPCSVETNMAAPTAVKR